MGKQRLRGNGLPKATRQVHSMTTGEKAGSCQKGLRIKKQAQKNSGKVNKGQMCNHFILCAACNHITLGYKQGKGTPNYCAFLTFETRATTFKEMGIVQKMQLSNISQMKREDRLELPLVSITRIATCIHPHLHYDIMLGALLCLLRAVFIYSIAACPRLIEMLRWRKFFCLKIH